MVTIRFDDGRSEEQVYTVHKGLICHYSSYFRGALEGRFREAKSRTITLPSEDKEGFRVFFSWIYTGRLYDAETDAGDKTWTPAYALFRGYVFADAKIIPTLKNVIIDRLMDLKCSRNCIPTSQMPYVWSNTTEGDKLRQLFIDWLTMGSLTPGFFNNNRAAYPADLLWSMVVATMNTSTRPAARSNTEWLEHRCDYHDHNNVTIKPAGPEGEHPKHMTS